ncbi:MAG: YkgJ family cysteine cluster protein, partial [Lachnospiraceae bacterium]|nr:YkgJ family cysteine cluster protein [Lachnospiraceae bacterium]
MMKQVLKAAGETGQQAVTECIFLAADGKCRIHGVRPGVCRLFPLGRQYEESGITYFDLEACDMPGKSKVRIDKWLGIPDLEEYHAFKENWHTFCKRLSDRLSEEDQDTRKKINTLMLHMFFMTGYDGDFYECFEVRRKQAEQILL